MTPEERGKADFLLSIGYYEAATGWTHPDLGGKALTLEQAYRYEKEMFK